jgi:SHS2 domain-containing protein
MPARHRFEDHTAEVALTLEADTLPELYAEAGRAVAVLLLCDPPPPPPPDAPTLTVELTAPDAAALLVDWVNELLYRTQVESTAFTDFAVTLAESGHTLRARIRGVEGAVLRGEIKAATLHQARVHPMATGYGAHLILDV